MKTLKENRKDVYVIFQKILGRDLTVTEHNELREVLKVFSDSNQERISMLEKQLQISGQKRNILSRTLYNKAKNAEILEKNIAFLKEEFINLK